jgi:hypothetical protein
MPARFSVGEGRPTETFNAVLIAADETGRARSIERVDREWTRDGE